MPEQPDKVAEKMGVHAPNSQVNIENLYVGAVSEDRQQEDVIDWQRICRSMLVEREQLTSNRLMASPDMHKSLDIFVDLALVQQKKADKRDGDVLPEYGSQLYEPSRYSESERFEFERFLNEVLGTHKNEKLTIIGEPGSGKTTLLQKIAFWLLDNTEDLVIWVSLGELKDKPLRDYLTEDWLGDAVVYADSRILEDWERQFIRKRAWLLLDGLDEMTPETRDALSLKGWVSQARTIVTCRLNVWQTNPRLINGFETYRMLEFRLPQVKEFIQKWFSEEKVAGQQLYQALNQPGKERIKDLVKNPLRLTLLCSTWHLREGKLPNTRTELYRQFADDLYEWKRERFPTSVKQRKDLNNRLGELAKKAIDKELTRFRLRQSLVHNFLGQPEDPNSMLGLALDLGWLNAVGVDPQNPRQPVYAFFHATFQEYFAASSIENWNFFLPSEHEDKPVEEIGCLGEKKRYRIFEPQWKEVILLWLGREDIENREKENFIEALLSFEDGCKNFYSYQAFFLATLGISELQTHSKARESIQKNIQWSFGRYDSDSGEWFSYFDPIEKQARVTLLSIGQSLVIGELTNLLKSIENRSVEYEMANFVIKIDPNNIESINALVSLLDKVEDDKFSLEASTSLIQISATNLKAERQLVNLSRVGQYEWIRRDAAWSLIKAKPNHPVGIDTLINLLCTSKDETILWSLRLGEIGMTSPKLLRTLFRMSYLGQTSEVRARSMNYLVETLASEEEALVKILEFLQLPKLILQSIKLIESNNNYDADYLIEIADLVDKARTSESKRERREAFWKIAKLTINDPDLVMLMVNLGTSSGGETRKKYVYELFNKINLDISVVVPLWMSLVNKLKDRTLRTFLAIKMADAGFEDERIPATLIDLLKSSDPQDENVQRWLAGALIEYAPTNAEAISTLLNLLQNSKNWNTCRWVTNNLGEACNENHLIIEQLLNLLATNQERRIVENVALGLKEVFQSDALKIIVNGVKVFLSEETWKSDFSLYKNTFEILWHCASKLPYPEFYATWHGQYIESKPQQDQVLLSEESASENID